MLLTYGLQNFLEYNCNHFNNLSLEESEAKIWNAGRKLRTIFLRK